MAVVLRFLELGAPNRRCLSTSACLFRRGDRRRRSCPVALTEKDTGPEYWDTPQYPPIVDPSPHAEKLREHQEWKQWITSMATVEEKLFHLIDDRLWTGYKLRGVPQGYNSLPLIQHATRTHLIRGAPPVPADVQVDEHYEALKGSLVEAVESALRNIAHRPPTAPRMDPAMAERWKTELVVRNVMRTLMAVLGPHHPHLQTAQVDLNPRCEAFWHCGGFALNPKEKKEIPPLDSKDQLFLFEHTPLANVRTVEPLRPLVSPDDDLCHKSDVPKIPHDPGYYSIKKVEKYPTLVPGCWPHKSSGFGHLSFHSLEEFQELGKKLTTMDENACISEYGIQASFAWLLGIATNQGFSPVSELTYPFTTQTVITDGQNWSFFAYQMNTCALLGDVDGNPLRNVCWELPRMRLYETVEDGALKGVNDDVFKQLIGCFTRTPAAEAGLELRPYLQDVEHYKEYWDHMAFWLWRQYAQRPKLNEFELYQWEEFYLHNNAYIAVNPRRKRRKQMPHNIPDDPKIRLEFPKLLGQSRRMY